MLPQGTPPRSTLRSPQPRVPYDPITSPTLRIDVFANSPGWLSRAPLDVQRLLRVCCGFAASFHAWSAPASRSFPPGILVCSFPHCLFAASSPPSSAHSSPPTLLSHRLNNSLLRSAYYSLYTTSLILAIRPRPASSSALSTSTSPPPSPASPIDLLRIALLTRCSYCTYTPPAASPSALPVTRLRRPLPSDGYMAALMLTSPFPLPLPATRSSALLCSAIQPA